MASWILTWNPKKFDWEEFGQAVDETRSGNVHESNWSCSRTRSISQGDRLYLLRQGSERGLIARGRAASDPYEDASWNPDDGPGSVQLYVDVEFDDVLDVPEVLPIPVLEERVPTNHWNRVQGSGIRVKDPVALDELWRSHLARVGRGA